MNKFLKNSSLVLAISLMSMAAAQAGSWDEDNAPPAGSVVTSDYTPVPHHGFYLGIEGGGTLLDDLEYNSRTKLTSNPGYNGGITLGYDYKWLRIEEELNAARNGADALQLKGFPDTSLDGNISSYSAMTNAIFNLRGDTGFGIFAGLGVGGSAIDYNYELAHPINGSSSDATWKAAFSAQALAGISYAFNPTVELDLEYRYLDSFVRDNNIPDYKTNNIDLGLKFFLT